MSTATSAPACASCANTRRPAWTSPRANTGTRPTISGDYSRRARWTCCKPTSADAAASPVSCRPPRCAMHFVCRCRRIARLHCICMWRALCRACAIGSGSTITCASRQCCLTEHRKRVTAQLHRTCRDRVAVSRSDIRTRHSTASNKRQNVGACIDGDAPHTRIVMHGGGGGRVDGARREQRDYESAHIWSNANPAARFHRGPAAACARC